MRYREEAIEDSEGRCWHGEDTEDQFTKLLAEGFPANLTSMPRDPFPIKLESFAMPEDHGRGFHDSKRFALRRPKPTQDDPEEFFSQALAWPRLIRGQNCKLLSRRGRRNSLRAAAITHEIQSIRLSLRENRQGHIRLTLKMIAILARFRPRPEAAVDKVVWPLYHHALLGGSREVIN